jgi:hypothetical protein
MRAALSSKSPPLAVSSLIYLVLLPSSALSLLPLDVPSSTLCNPLCPPFLAVLLGPGVEEAIIDRAEVD